MKAGAVSVHGSLAPCCIFCARALAGCVVHGSWGLANTSSVNEQ